MATTQRPAGGSAMQTWAIDPAHTSIEFSAKHMMITTVRGMFGDVTGTLHVDPRRPDDSRVEAEIAAASIDTKNEQRDQHLRGPEFLDAEHYPTLTFRSRRVEGAHARPGDRFRIDGDLTIRGTTLPVTLRCTYEGHGKDPWGGERVAFGAQTTLDRRDWALTWNQALEAGGVLVSNEIQISIEVQALLQEPAK